MFCIKIASFCFKTGLKIATPMASSRRLRVLKNSTAYKLTSLGPLRRTGGIALSGFSEKSKVDLRKCFKIS